MEAYIVLGLFVATGYVFVEDKGPSASALGEVMFVVLFWPALLMKDIIKWGQSK